MLSINRPSFSQYEFERTYIPCSEPADDNGSCGGRIFPRCSRVEAKRLMLERLPAISVICNYKWRKWLLWDIIAGLSVGFIHIPQSMGFALLTSVPPVLGLYSSLFPVIIYFLFGTSRHISIGTMAVISIMIGAVVNREIDKITDYEDFTNNTSNVTDYTEYKIDIATSVTLLMGIFQVCMSLLRLGILGSLMSMTFIGGFLTGAACLIISAQVPSLLGLQIPSSLGLFRVPLIWYSVFSQIKHTNTIELAISVISILLLIFLKMIINERCGKKLRIPIPAELILVIAFTLASHYLHLAPLYNVKIVGPIARGIPPPKVPSLTNAQSYIADSFSIAFVSFTLSISMAKMFSNKYGYSINDNQEMFAYGMSYGVSAFFSCFGGAQAPPRALVHESTGGKTQLASLFSSALVLLVCLYLGPLFESVPNVVLSSIIVVALLPLFKECFKLKHYWRVNKSDLIVWLSTCLVVIFIDISIGLVTGILLNIITVLAASYSTKGNLLVPCDQTELYRRSNLTKQLAKNPRGVKIFSYESPLFYANVDKFKQELFQQTNFNPFSVGIKCEDIMLVAIRNTEACELDLQKDAIIIDSSGITYVDVMAIDVLNALKKSYKEAGVKFILAGCRENMIAKLKKSGYINEEGLTNDDLIFPTVHDAVMVIKTNRKY